MGGHIPEIGKRFGCVGLGGIDGHGRHRRRHDGRVMCSCNPDRDSRNERNILLLPVLKNAYRGIKHTS
jgi:hypothetical protein